MTRASEKICDVIVEAGIDHVFGIPGGHTLGIFKEQARTPCGLCRRDELPEISG